MMVRTGALLVILAVAGFSNAQAQSRVYFGAIGAADAGERGNIPGGAIPSLGGLFGVRISKAWSIEAEIERGFRTTTAGTGESVLVSFPPVRNPTPEEIEQYGIRVKNDRTQTAGAGWAAHAVWRTREPGRINYAVLMGVASRIYNTCLTRTTTFVSPLLDLPLTYSLPDSTSARRMVAGGPSGGILILVRATNRLTIAPELRVDVGLITDDPYRVFRSGIRGMWGF